MSRLLTLVEKKKINWRILAQPFEGQVEIPTFQLEEKKNYLHNIYVF